MGANVPAADSPQTITVNMRKSGSGGCAAQKQTGANGVRERRGQTFDESG